jgi:hypothetical protein
MENENAELDQKKQTRYTIQIGEHLAEKIDRHLRLLKFCGRKDIKKQAWIKEAILSKLGKEEHLPPYTFPKQKNLNLDIDSELRGRLERVVKSIRKVRRTYSKKQWILEALAERLEQEEEEAKSLARDLDKP